MLKPEQTELTVIMPRKLLRKFSREVAKAFRDNRIPYNKNSPVIRALVQLFIDGKIQL